MIGKKSQWNKGLQWKPTHQDLIDGIEAYLDLQNDILTAIKSNGGRLHQDEFDRLFSDQKKETLPDGTTVITRVPPVFRPFKMTPKTFMLGDYTGSELHKMIHLVQIMCRIGTVKTEVENGKIVYCMGDAK